MNIRNRTPIWRRCIRAVALRAFHAVENNDRAEIERNGEGWLLRELAGEWQRQSHAPVVFDVGANVGGYTQQVLKAVARAGVTATVHAIEPSAICIEQLQRRFSGLPNVRIQRAAVGSQKGVKRLRAATPGSSLASLVDRYGIPDVAGEDVPVERLDSLLEQADVNRLDLLKLDVEGGEFEALRGLGSWLDPNRIELIQFEYGGATLDAQTSLRALSALLEARGYRLAKLFPRALEFREYAPWMDHFSYANFVALSATHPDVGK